MPGNFKKDDLRVIKTYKVILVALHKLLEHRNFRCLTINDLCEEAQISRATFYAHFKDKYDLLKYWLTSLKLNIINNNDNKYKNIETTVNHFIDNNTKVIINLLGDANKETIELLHEFMISILDITVEKNKDGKLNPEYIVLTNFCAGGMINYLSWVVENKFPPDLHKMNTYFCSLLTHLLEWEED